MYKIIKNLGPLLGLVLPIYLIKCLRASAAQVFPDQFHCLAEIRCHNSKLDSWYLVDEFVDISNARSSLRLYDVAEGTTSIYFKEDSDLKKPGLTKFIVYDEDKETCNVKGSNDWPLRGIRKAAVLMQPLNKLSPSTLDLMLGPSAFLTVVNSSLAEFKFVKRVFSELQLTNVDVYERAYDKAFELLQKNQVIVITLQVIARGSESLRVGKNLSDFADQVQFISATVCLCDKDSFDRRIPSEEYRCQTSELLFDINYYVLTNLVTGSLTGRELYQARASDFLLDPFVPSVGVGCWRDIHLVGHRKFRIPSSRFSAEYIGYQNMHHVSYIAYDGSRNLLRLDKAGRKNIFDLNGNVSYHIDEFSLITELAKETAGKVRCVMFDMKKNNDSPTYFSMEELIGIGNEPGNTAAIHLGSKTIDHVVYEVFEIELIDCLLGSCKYPVVMQGPGLSGPAPGFRYFMTYYMNEFKNRKTVQGDTSYPDDTILVPRYIDLWALNPDNNKKSLVNSIEFTQFSWSLDVEPDGDTTNTGTNSLFYDNLCADDRSHQLELQFELDCDEKTLEGNRNQAKEIIRSQIKPIREALEVELHDMLGVSGPSIANFKVAFKGNSPDLLVKARIVELINGDLVKFEKGNVNFLDISKSIHESILGINLNSHSLADCQLDSLSQTKENMLVYCEKMTTCVQFESNAVRGYIDKLDKNESKTSKSEYDLDQCILYDVYWIKTETASRGLVMMDRVSSYLFELKGQKLLLDLTSVSTANNTLQNLNYRPAIRGPKVKTLDSIGLHKSLSKLDGFRYMTPDEDAARGDTNQVVELDQIQRDSMVQCQLACQMDPYCQSFSYCSRGKSNSQLNDCVMSTMRLSPSKVKEIANLIGDQLHDAEVVVRDGGELMKLIRDPFCNLHPKDFQSTFRLIESDDEILSNYTDSPEKMAVTLDECAEQSYDLGLWSKEIAKPVNFTYCSLSAACYTDEVDAIADKSGKPCNRYSRSFQQYYKWLAYSRLALELPSDQKIDGRPSIANVTKIYEGLDSEQCARLCSLRSYTCLAYDSCRITDDRSICITYAIRSQIATKSNRLGLLPLEEFFYGQSAICNVTLVSNQGCSHFALIGGYAETRVRQIRLALSKSPRENNIINLEREIIQQSLDKSDLEHDADEMKHEAELDDDPPATGGNHGFQHFMLFLSGLVLACGGILINPIDKWTDWRVMLSRRHREPRISQLNLPTNLSF